MYQLTTLVICLATWSICLIAVNCDCLTREEWRYETPTNYSEVYSPITDEDAEPLGFRVGTYIYNSEKGTCVTVFDTAGKRVEVKVETQPPTTICVRANGVEDCTQADGRITLCQPFNSGSTTFFEFYCNSECAEADVAFWYRFAVSPGLNADADERWCWDRVSRYPTDLFELPFVPSTNANSSTAQQPNSTTHQQPNNTTAHQQHSSSTSQQHNNTTGQQHNGSTAQQQHHSTTAQQHNNTTEAKDSAFVNHSSHLLVILLAGLTSSM